MNHFWSGILVFSKIVPDSTLKLARQVWQFHRPTRWPSRLAGDLGAAAERAMRIVPPAHRAPDARGTRRDPGSVGKMVIRFMVNLL